LLLFCYLSPKFWQREVTKKEPWKTECYTPTSQAEGDVSLFDRFQVIDFPYEDANCPIGSVSKRRSFNLLVSNIYSENFNSFMADYNSKPICDKYADGLVFNNTTEIIKYTGLSDHMIECNSILFPLRLWGGKQKYHGSCVIILGLHLKSNTKSICQIFPIILKTNAFGEWNDNYPPIPEFSSRKSVLATFWAHTNPIEVDSKFTESQLISFGGMLEKYYQQIHKTNAESYNIKGKLIIIIIII
jgi:hypothetical protein